MITSEEKQQDIQKIVIMFNDFNSHEIAIEMAFSQKLAWEVLSMLQSIVLEKYKEIDSLTFGDEKSSKMVEAKKTVYWNFQRNNFQTVRDLRTDCSYLNQFIDIIRDRLLKEF